MYEIEQAKAAKALVFWHGVFAICFIVWMVIATIGGMALLKEISAVSQCVHLDDQEFRVCYDLKKQ